MRLCIASPMPIRQLEALVNQCFGTLPSGQLASDDWPSLYTENELGIQINIHPLQSARRMIVTLPSRFTERLQNQTAELHQPFDW